MGTYSLKIAFLFLISSLAFAGEGEVTFFIFKGQLPASYTSVKIDGKDLLKTDENGVLTLDLESGKHEAHVFNSKDSFHKISFDVVEGEETVLNYTILEDKIAGKQSNSHSEVFQKEETVNTGEIASFSGKVLSHSKKGKLNKTKIIVHGMQKEFQTDANGNFDLDLPEGNYTISFLHDGYSTTTLSSVSLAKENKVQETVLLKPSGLELEEFVVLSPNMKSSVSALLEVRRGHQTIADLIGSEQMSRSGDSDAGSSLKRVTGLSLVGGRFVYVRGLGERYSSTLLNSSMVPSPDPSRRVVPLDLFPASVIENMVVQKGYSPEMPGEFGGGAIQIKTKTLPAAPYLKFSLSQAYQPMGNAKTYEGSKRDFTGFDSGARELPSEIQDLIDNGVNISSLPAEERKRLGSLIQKNYNTRSFEGSDRQEIPNFSISGGAKHYLGKLKFGYNISSIYSNTWNYNEEQRSQYNQSGSGLTLDSDFAVENSQNRIKLGGLVGVGVEYQKQKLKYSGAMLRNSDSFVFESDGINSEQEEIIRSETGWRERSIVTHQFAGEHYLRSLGKSKLEWTYSTSEAKLDEPDNKMFTYIKEDGVYALETENGSASNTVSWRSMPDELQNTTIDYTLPLDGIGLEDAKFKVGINQMSRERGFNSQTFYFRFSDANIDGTQDPNSVFSNQDGELFQQSNNTDNYSAKQDINAWYGNLSLPMGPLTVTGGMRFENSVQEVESFRLFNAGQTKSVLETSDYLPVVSFNYKISSAMQIRANYSETLSRPDLREISNTIWNDIDLGAKFVGNPRLDAARIKNYGFRWEWYFNRGENLSLGYFRKEFTNPIEEIFGSLSEDGRIVGTTDTQYTYINIDQATSQGIEFEFRKKLGWNFTLGGNYSWIKSDVNISPEKAGQLTSLNRPLQGQSPYLLNAQLDYDLEKTGLTMSLLYNTIGRRITGVGADGRPDEFEEEIATLDFVASAEIKKGWKLRAKVKNILNPELRRTQGDKTTRVTQRGQFYSVGLSGSF